MLSEPGDVLADVREGLSRPQKELPSRLFYDERGSELFEEITRLPEYYLTRAEQDLLEAHVPCWVARLRPRSLVELGAGSAVKTRVFLSAMHDREESVTYVPIDISAEFLERTAAALRAEYPRLRVRPLATSFARALDRFPEMPRPALVIFPGSTIGNFTEEEATGLLRSVRRALRRDDAFLLGVDLRKDVAVLEAAYNDSRGVTAAFNVNMLRVLNERFGADFDLQGYRHCARYDTRAHRIEMHLVSTRAQSVSIPGAGVFQLHDGETIRTEISSKYDRASVQSMFDAAGLRLREWHEDDGGRYALALATPRESAATVDS